MDKRKAASFTLAAWLALGMTAFAANSPDADDVTAGTQDIREEARVGEDSSPAGGKENKTTQSAPLTPAQKPTTAPAPSSEENRIKKLEETVKTHDKELEKKVAIESLSPTGELTGILLTASLSLSALSLLVGALALIKAGKAKDAEKALDAQMKSLQAAQAAQSNHPEYITGTEFDEIIDLLHKRIDGLGRPTPQTAAPAAPVQPVAAPAATNPDDEWRPFVDAYNSLLQRVKSMPGMEAKNAKNGFVHQFGVQAFKCVNYQNRVGHPEIPPQFAEDTAVTGSFWAVPFRGDSFAVVPNLKTYEAQIHDTGGMKEAFRSNFVSGKTFNSIVVVRPAIFATGWTVLEPGELRLS